MASAPPNSRCDEALVIADDDADASAVALGGGAERGFQLAVARAQQRQPPARPHERRQGVGEEVHALLPGQAADDAEQGRGVAVEAEALLQRRTIDGAAGRACGRHRSPRGGCRSRGPIRRSSMPLTMPDRSSARAGQQALEPHAGFRRLDLRGIAGRYGRDAVREEEAGLEEADHAVILDAGDRHRIRRQAQRRPAWMRGYWPWKARLWTVITVAARCRPE